MTQRTPRPPRPPIKKVAPPPPPPSSTPFQPEPGVAVRLKTGPEVGLVTESDEWQDTLLLRGVDISEQTLVEWRRNGHPVRRWERTSQLEAVQQEADDQ